MLSNEEFSELFNGFEKSCFRLEALDHYWVEDDGRFQAFSEGRPRPISTPGREEWIRTVADSVNSGRVWQRVHVVDEVTPYIRFEIEWGYPETVRVGEQIRILLAPLHGGRSTWPDRDFWLFDDQIVVWMDYDTEGKLLDRQKVTDQDIVEQCRISRDLMFETAEPYESFMKKYTSKSA